LKNKTITVSWTDTLSANTTYVFNFGAGITDLTEGNKATEAMYVLSTGNEIDSLSLKGTAADAWSGEPAKQKRIVMFESDSLITSRKAKPVSIGITKDDGGFTLPYLSHGNFSIFALDDANSNYLWDEGEAVGFLQSQVSPAWKDSVKRKLLLSTPRPSKPTVGEYKIDSLGKITFAWDHYFKGISLRSLNPDATVVWSTKKDSIVAWVNTKQYNKSIEIKVAVDSIVLDTIGVKVISEAIEKPLRLSAKPTDRILPKSTLTLAFNQGIASVDASKVNLKIDSTLLAPPSAAVSNNEVLLNYNWLAGKKYNLQLLPGAIAGVFGNTNDTLDVTVSVLSAEETGTLNLTIQAPELAPSAFLLVLDNKQNEVFRAPISTAKEMSIPNIIPGEHVLKLVNDINGNGIWDPADFKKRQAPERVWTFGQKLNIRANWDINQTWIIEE
jgi:hypothetical protein